MKIALALSGGGYRGAAFSLGVLHRLALENRLEEIELLSTESGGSLAAGLVFSLNDYHWPTSQEYLGKVVPLAMASLTSDARDLQPGFWELVLRWLFGWLGGGKSSLPGLLRKRWGILPRLDDLPERPRWLINATCSETGKRWVFEREGMGGPDFGYSDRTNIPLSEAIAASANTLGLFSPVVIETGGRVWYAYPDQETPPPENAGSHIREGQRIEAPLPQLHIYDTGGMENLDPFMDGWEARYDFLVVSDGFSRSQPEGYRSGLNALLRRGMSAKEEALRELKIQKIRNQVAINRLVERVDNGAILQLGSTCKEVAADYKMEEQASELCKDTRLSNQEVQLAAMTPTSYRHLTQNLWTVLHRHGYEVANFTLHAARSDTFTNYSGEITNTQVVQTVTVPTIVLPATPAPAPEPPSELVEAVAGGQCVLFAGGGMAAQAGLPLWREFMQGLLEYALVQEKIDPRTAANLSGALQAGDYGVVASELVAQLPVTLIQEYANSTYLGAKPSSAHRTLGELPLAGVLSTSYDSLYQEVFKSREPASFTPENAAGLVEALREKRFFALNLYGQVGNADASPFTERQLRAEWRQNTMFRDFMDTLLQRYTMLFLGASTAEIKVFLDAISLAGSKKLYQRQFALVGEPRGLNDLEVRYLEREYNLQIIPFQPGEDYSQVPDFLNSLRSAVGRLEMPQAAAEALLIDRLMLENIGPFKDLTVKFCPEWNVLLGDNGMGKSVILRAIAAALCGELIDETAVKRLLRREADYGIIEVWAGKRSYKVELVRDADDQVQISSRSLSPLKLDKWLALGFPALRAMTWQRPDKVPEEDRWRRLPSPQDDLQPILTGQPDTRLNNLKEWVIRLDYQASGSSPEAKKAEELKRKFFEILEFITPDVKVVLNSINRRTMEILLETDNGVVPLEMISQGTASVICWVGTLLQRIYEVYGGENEAAEGSALVLVDEIDAHMHPSWQRWLPMQIREVFPRVQVIANTHSPLIVGSLSPEEILVARRTPLVAETDGVVKEVKTRITTDTLKRAYRQQQQTGSFQIDESREQQYYETEVFIETADGREMRYTAPTEAQVIVKAGDKVEAGEPLTASGALITVQPSDVDVRGWRADQILTYWLFGLDSARSPEMEEIMDEYTRLAAQDYESLNPEDRKKLEDYAQQLKIRLPAPHERKQARDAYELIQAAVQDEIKKIPPEEREAILKELKLQTQESITQSRRPQ